MSLENYEDVNTRIHRFYEKNPAGRILTHLEHVERATNGAPVQYIVRAEVYTDTLISSGYAEEIVGTSKVNQTSALENCETSAIGRALANAGYSPKAARPSKEEMGKVERVKATTPVKDWDTPSGDPWLVRDAVDVVAQELGAVVTRVDGFNGPLGRANNATGSASDKQKGFVRRLVMDFPEVDTDTEMLEAINGLLMQGERGEVSAIEDLSKTQASYLIEVIKGGAK